MEKLVTLTSVAVPLPIDNCDTDQIMPKQFLRGIDKSGLARGTFFNMRYDAQGQLREDCLFNQSEYKDAKIIVAGPNFGCGSSREHAVWGLMQMGFRVVIATGFGEIFIPTASIMVFWPPKSRMKCRKRFLRPSVVERKH